MSIFCDIFLTFYDATDELVFHFEKTGMIDQNLMNTAQNNSHLPVYANAVKVSKYKPSYFLTPY